MNPDMPFQGAFDPRRALLAALALTGWIGASGLQRRWAPTAVAALLPLHAARLGLAGAFWMAALGLVAAAVETVGAWPHWFIAASAAVAAELALGCYSACPPEAPRRVRLLHAALPLLRVAMIGFLALLLLEPIHSRQEVHEDERFVAVLLDASDSMMLGSRSASDGGLTRREVAERLLAGGDAPAQGLLDRLAEDYQVRLYRFGATARPTDPGKWRADQAGAPRPAAGSTPWSAATDFANALQQLDGDLPPEVLSGAILLTDGCDHSAADPRQAGQRLIRHKVPIHSVVIGSQTPIRDAAVVAVEAPPQVFQGDSVAFRATLKIDQAQGQTATVTLVKDGQKIDSKTIAVASNRCRETVVFRHQPPALGVHRYTVRIEPLPNEDSQANNAAERFVAVSKDHLCLLVIDERPRWEYRYLRNLFSGRDRTVHLQAVLLQPDRLAGVPNPPTMRASALRAFDDCEATALPAKLEDWLKFDAIILGDVPPDRLGEPGLRALEAFVKNRGGTLIVIAGPNHMPHDYAKTPLADLLPARLDRAFGPTAASPDESYWFAPSRDAPSQFAMRQLGAGMDGLALAFPALSWRHPACEAKPGATVLGYAAKAPPGGLDDAAEAGAPALEQQRNHALMLWQRFGAGKVLQMNFDQSWRLRFGVGDKFHHQFWGQLVRWAVRERLPAGTDLVRLGLDRSQCQAGDAVVVRARLLDAQRNAVNAEGVQALVYDGDKLVEKAPLVVQPDSGGLLQGELRDLKQAGKYRIELAGAAVEELLAAEGKPGRKVSADLVVIAPSESPESADVAADPTVPTQLADASGGKVVTPERVEDLLKALGPKSNFQRERWTTPLWNGWPVMLAFLGGVCLEWTLRRARGLA